MKKIIIIIVSCMFLFVNQGLGNIIWRPTSTQYWAYWSSPDNKCYPFGTDCYVVIIYHITSTTIDKLPNDTYSIEVTFGSNINQGHSSTGQQPINLSYSTSNYHFGPGEYITIDECSEYPELNGRQVNLNGLSTDSQGKLILIIQ